MNGVQSTDPVPGDEPGNTGDAGSSPQRRRGVDNVVAAWLALEDAEAHLGSDIDLARAKEKIRDWLAREAGVPREGLRRSEAPHGEAAPDGQAA